MKIKAEPCTGRDLKPGDLFSTVGPEYWDAFSARDSLGERCYIRTEQSLNERNSQDADRLIYRLTVDREEVWRCPRCEAENQAVRWICWKCGLIARPEIIPLLVE